MNHLTANDLKTRGVGAIESALSGGRTEAVVSVRGAQRFVVMELAEYRRLRERELDAALAETRAEIAAGRFVVESAQQHVARLQGLIAAEAGTSGAGQRAKTSRAKEAVSVRSTYKPSTRKAG